MEKDLSKVKYGDLEMGALFCFRNTEGGMSYYRKNMLTDILFKADMDVWVNDKSIIYG